MADGQRKNPRKKRQSQKGDTSGEVQQQAQGVAHQAEATAGQVAQQVQDTAGQVAQEGQQQAMSVAQTRKTKASQSLDQVGIALQEAGQQLRQQGQTVPGQTFVAAGRQVDHVAGYLDSHTVREIVGEVEHFGRRRPVAFLGGAFALGFALSRFLKSSPPSGNTALGSGT